MTEQQQELYDKLLKKVNEYCLGAAAEYVIAAIDALVENYEKSKKRISKTKDQLLVENEAYQLMLHTVRYYVESKEYSLEDLVKRLKALEILKEWFEIFKDRNGYHIRSLFDIGSVNKEEGELLKEVLK